MPVQKWNATRRARFLKKLAETGNVSAAARTAGASRSRVYQLKAKSPAFAAQWADALETATDALDAEARRRDGEEVFGLSPWNSGRPSGLPTPGTALRRGATW